MLVFMILIALQIDRSMAASSYSNSSSPSSLNSTSSLSPFWTPNISSFQILRLLPFEHSDLNWILLIFIFMYVLAALWICDHVLIPVLTLLVALWIFRFLGLLEIPVLLAAVFWTLVLGEAIRVACQRIFRL